MKIAIIGAGFAGLTSARHLRDFGHDVTVFEKVHDVGGVWSKTRLYPGISTQNGKDTYHLSDYPMPKAYPEWPAGHQVQEYLAGYVRDFNLGPLLRLSTTVTAATQGADGRWTLTFRREGGDEQSEAFDFLTICNGIFSVPAVPEFAGADEFRAAGGTICHSSQFINLDEARGKHVIVIGYGKSSCDVAVGLADVTASMTVVARELIWKMPRKIAGVLNYKYLFLTRMALEKLVVETLSGKLTKEQIDTLSAHIDAEDAARAEHAQSIRLAGEFHTLLAQMTNNASLIRYVNETVARSSLILALYGRPHSSECAVSEHRDLLNHLIAGKTDAAAKLMTHHLDSVTTRALLPKEDDRNIKDVLSAYAVAEGLV